MLNSTSLNSVCPPGHYCPPGSSAPQLCPPGTNSTAVGLSNVTECQDCVKGMYCPLSGTVLATRRCLKGYFCPSGTANPAANSSLVCPAGSKCPVGSSSPIACALGTYQDQRGNDTCKTCPAGYYCNSATNVPALGILVGTASPTVCPVGQYCVQGSAHYTPCPIGKYQDNTGWATCKPCPVGFTCNNPNGTTAPKTCPLRKFCPLGSTSGTTCPNGTYGQYTGLDSAANCTKCPGGKYCFNGQIAGICAKGYFCRESSATPTPSVNISTLEWRLQIPYLLSLLIGQCPPNHYCPANSTDPTPCRNGTLRLITGGSSQNDCEDCPAGAICFAGGRHSRPCDEGYLHPFKVVLSSQFTLFLQKKLLLISSFNLSFNPTSFFL